MWSTDSSFILKTLFTKKSNYSIIKLTDKREVHYGKKEFMDVQLCILIII